MAQKNNALSAIFSHYLTWAAVAVVVGLEAGFFYWFRPSLVMAGGAVGLGLVMLLLWFPIFLKSDLFSRSVFEWVAAEEALQRAKLEELAADFADMNFPQGGAQIRLLQDKLASLTEILRRQLDSGEITYSRYLGMAQEVFGAAIDNLHEVGVVLRSVSTIDVNYIRDRLLELDSGGEKTVHHEREYQALQERTALLEDQTKRVAELMAQNESAMTVIDRTAAAMAGTRTAQGMSKLDAETAMAELEQLAKRAGKYAASR
jgi:uncharacterized membrane protein